MWDDSAYRKRILQGVKNLPNYPVLKELKLSALDVYTRNEIEAYKIPVVRTLWATFIESSRAVLDFEWENQVATNHDFAKREPIEDHTQIMFYREEKCPYGFEWDCSKCFVYSFLKEKEGERTLFCTGIRYDNVLVYQKNGMNYKEGFHVVVNEKVIGDIPYISDQNLNESAFKMFSTYMFHLSEKMQ